MMVISSSFDGSWISSSGGGCREFEPSSSIKTGSGTTSRCIMLVGICLLGGGRPVLGLPNREGNILFGRLIPVGEDGNALSGALDFAPVGTGDPARTKMGTGELDLNPWAGDVGRARREAPGTAGLAGRGRPPTLVPIEGEAGRPPIPAMRVTAGAVAENDGTASGMLGAGTRRSRSSS